MSLLAISAWGFLLSLLVCAAFGFVSWHRETPPDRRGNLKNPFVAAVVLLLSPVTTFMHGVRKRNPLALVAPIVVLLCLPGAVLGLMRGEQRVLDKARQTELELLTRAKMLDPIKAQVGELQTKVRVLREEIDSHWFFTEKKQAKIILIELLAAFLQDGCLATPEHYRWAVLFDLRDSLTRVQTYEIRNRITPAPCDVVIQSQGAANQ